ncbi:hypothetical protein ES332_D01G236400v1 [Gossypium tomentosum]|uniref:Uncharacterized protein n=1 Tax=Gossypium tomentosum TaxID=34277 RepID=A0A5D2MD90_GOSTO|nr:hypothetical protein ES332_D01G236400v1 [Gossypium tomentosum]
MVRRRSDSQFGQLETLTRAEFTAFCRFGASLPGFGRCARRGRTWVAAGERQPRIPWRLGFPKNF